MGLSACDDWSRAARATDSKLLAVSDLHVAYREDREVIESLHPESASDWLLVARDVGEWAAAFVPIAGGSCAGAW